MLVPLTGLHRFAANAGPSPRPALKQIAALAYPWPIHRAVCTDIISHSLRFEPDAFDAGVGAHVLQDGSTARE